MDSKKTITLYLKKLKNKDLLRKLLKIVRMKKCQNIYADALHNDINI